MRNLGQTTMQLQDLWRRGLDCRTMGRVTETDTTTMVVNQRCDRVLRAALCSACGRALKIGLNIVR